MPKERPHWPDDRAREDWRLRLALLKESVAYREFWADHADAARSAYKNLEALNRELRDAKPPDAVAAAFQRYSADVDTITSFNGRLRAFGLIGPYGGALDVLDPRTEDTPEKLPVFFREPPAIVQVEIPGVPLEARAGVPFRESLTSSERILKIDLSRKRGEIEVELKRYLDAVGHYRKDTEDTPEAWRENYEEWEPDKTRFRVEAWQALQIYRLRRKRKRFLEIARTLEIQVPAAKKAFARAYELIEGRRHDPDFFKREAQAVRLPELRKTCDTCPLRDTCKELCPDVLPYVVQDEVTQRELSIDSSDPFLANAKTTYHKP